MRIRKPKGVMHCQSVRCDSCKATEKSGIADTRHRHCPMRGRASQREFVKNVTDGVTTFTMRDSPRNKGGVWR